MFSTSRSELPNWKSSAEKCPETFKLLVIPTVSEIIETHTVFQTVWPTTSKTFSRTQTLWFHKKAKKREGKKLTKVICSECLGARNAKSYRTLRCKWVAGVTACQCYLRIFARN